MLQHLLRLVNQVVSSRPRNTTFKLPPGHALQALTRSANSEMTKLKRQACVYHFLNIETRSTTSSPSRVAGNKCSYLPNKRYV